MQPCFAYKNYRCAILSEWAYAEIHASGDCGTVRCPFYKPDKLVERVGDAFRPYPREIAELLRLNR